MRKLLVKDLHPGMITAEDIFSIDGQLILPKKIILTQNGIDLLRPYRRRRSCTAADQFF